ncbi:probable serine/threonine-protein kinase DDB_G0280133 isoform X1 [Stomoxys calcitrans]|uniref:probable serine/threonine-protein kinase DDB_G0280133 isoform X1 n=2 Tax=Stomoxys calcitrans TaxID=35570 RepID=UPI0027E2ADFA|nr:probable serine/threonine-protein kinase DDB_G0280133 isoform X1 [Stomoxys calcitrans]
MQHQSSSSAMKTLKGIFQEPKMNHRRDFLRENKLNLRELQKNTTNKLAQQQQDLERKQHKHLHRYHKSHEQQPNVGRRSDSLQRYDDNDKGQYQSSRMTTGRGTDGNMPNRGTAAAAAAPQRQMSFRRSYSQQRNGSRENIQQTATRNGNEAYVCNNPLEQKANRVPRSGSAMSIISKAESCDKEIQTEDILDEEFLYEALKKCSSTEAEFSNKQIRETAKSDTKSNNYRDQEPSKYINNDNKSRERVSYDYNHRDVVEERQSHEQITHYTARSQCSEMENSNKVSLMTEQHQNHYDEELPENFQNLQINAHMPREQETQSSARSRQTMFSNTSKRKSNGNYKLGSRDEIRLPRYLEKEKREKEEQRQRVISQDPNCPLGHYALSEEERVALLNGAKKKMESLVLELNRMPMTTETLRIRRRKVEIEKELSQIELNIRAFSKPKVYVPASDCETSMPY